MIEDFCTKWCKYLFEYGQGGEGGIDLAEKVIKAIENNTTKFDYFYDANLTIKEKIEKICKEIYGADGVTFGAATKKFLN